ncbi:MAG: hypothetical protein ACLFQV_03870 [Vulcanimicrobiota bacterium]
MTSINALRFNEYSGIIIGDETITTVAEMKVNLGEKVRSCIPTAIAERYGVVAALGSTGTCSVGDTVQEMLENRLLEIYQAEIDKHGKPLENFMNLEQICKICFDVVVEIKHSRIGEKVKGTYNFSIPEFIEAKYEREGKTFDIKDSDTIREVLDMMVWRHETEAAGFVFLNAGLLAGYDDELGFQIYHFDFRDGYWHRVQNCYMAEGSGRHSVDPTLYGYAEKWLVEERRGGIDPVEGSIALIHGVNSASEHEIGVGGYYNIILVDGKQKSYKKRFREINDDRSLLANHIVRALDEGFLAYRQAYGLIEGILFKNQAFQESYDKFWKTAKNPHDLSRVLRGYKLHSKKLFQG